MQRIDGVPECVLYWPEFITQEEADALWQNIYSAPKPKWRTLQDRRLQNWGGLPHPKGMLAEPLPNWLSAYCQRLGELDIFSGARVAAPNHVLINEYLAGQGIMPHEDGPMYYPTVATISLGSHTYLDMYRMTNPTNEEEEGAAVAPRSTTPEFSLLLEPRSLVVLKQELYTGFMHGIAERDHDIVTDQVKNAQSHTSGTVLQRTTRVSLTFRVVEKVIKTKLNILGSR